MKYGEKESISKYIAEHMSVSEILHAIVSEVEEAESYSNVSIVSEILPFISAIEIKFQNNCLSSDDKLYTFKMPSESMFRSKRSFRRYINRTRCAVCHKKLKEGDEFYLRPIQSPRESGSLTVQAVIVHKKCLEE